MTDGEEHYVTPAESDWAQPLGGHYGGRQGPNTIQLPNVGEAPLHEWKRRQYSNTGLHNRRLVPPAVLEHFQCGD